MSSATVWHLPSEVLVLIFSFLPVEDIGRAASVCSQWSQVTEDRRVWANKNFLCEGGHRLLDALPVVRALPVLKRVSICWGNDLRVYLNGELADFVVPDLRDEAVTSAISTLVTQNLSVEFCLLQESCSNCLVVQLHELKELKIYTQQTLLSRVNGAGKLRALSDTLSRESLFNLQSVDICTKIPFDVKSDILGALSTCSALEQLTVRMHCSLSWHTVNEFSKLQSLQLRDCTIEDISFLELCPNLYDLLLGKCPLLKMQGLPRTSELRSLILRGLSVNGEFVAALCDASPKLQRITIDECPYVTHTQFLSHCPELCFVEVKKLGCTSMLLIGLPSRLQHLRLSSPLVKSDALADILQGTPRLEILDIVNCNFESLRFLRHCPGLTELSLGQVGRNIVQHFSELGVLKGLKKLHLCYNYSDIGPLADALHKMDQLESLSVLLMRSVSNFSFLRYCHRLQCLTFRGFCSPDGGFMCFHELSNLKELRKLDLETWMFRVEDLVAFLPSMLHLEELNVTLVGTECNLSFLRYCGQLISLQFSSLDDGGVPHLTQLRKLECLRRLTVVGLLGKYRHLLAEEVLRLRKLEYLSLRKGGTNFLESWEWLRCFTHRVRVLKVRQILRKHSEAVLELANHV